MKNCIVAMAAAHAAEAITGPAIASIDARIRSSATPTVPAAVQVPSEVPAEWTRIFPKVTRWEIRRKAKVHDDMNPIHHSDAAARAHKRQFKAIVACMMQLEGYIAATISEKIPGIVARKIKEIELVHPLYPGAIPTVHCELVVKRGFGFLKSTLKNGDRIIAVGEYAADLP